MDFLKILAGFGIVLLGILIIAGVILIIIFRSTKTKQQPNKGAATPVQSPPLEVDEAVTQQIRKLPQVMNLAQQGQYKEAIELLNASNSGDLLVKAFLLHQIGNYQQSLRTLEKLLQEQPSNSISRLFYIHVLLKMELPIPAEVQIRLMLTLQLEPHLHAAVNRLGELITVSSEEAAICDYFARWMEYYHTQDANQSSQDRQATEEESHQLRMCRETLKKIKEENGQLHDRLSELEARLKNTGP